MEFTTKVAIVVADDLKVWQKLNVVAFLTSGMIGAPRASLERRTKTPRARDTLLFAYSRQ